MTHPNSLEYILAAWNESVPSMVRSHLELALASGVEFIDRSIETQGLDEFEANVHNVQAEIPGAEYSRTSGVDSHHGLHRFSSQISRDGEIVVTGFDVTEVDGDSKFTRVLGFFGPLPDKESN